MTEAIHADRRDPEQPEGAFDLFGAAEELLDQARAQSAGRAARTLTPGVGAPLKQTILALQAGRSLDEHQAPGPATIQVLGGKVLLGTDGVGLELSQGDWAAIPDRVHDLRAETDATVLLTVVMPN